MKDTTGVSPWGLHYTDIHMSTERHHFLFFGNKEISSLYITLGLLSFGEGLVTIFVPIYFWEIGMPVWQIVFFYFLNSLYFVCFSFLLLPLMRRMSDKLMMFLSIPFMILYFSGLGFIAHVPLLFYALPVCLALSMLLFNVGYHINFSSVSDDDHVGREVGMRYAVSWLMKLAAPFLGGVIITLFGFDNAFLASTGILLLATLPLFIFPQRKIASHLSASSVTAFLFHKKLYPFTVSGIGYATQKEVLRIVWPLFIFFSIGTIEGFGAVISLGLLAGTLVTLFTGFLSDSGRRRKVLSWATGIFAFIWMTRPFLGGPIAVVGSNVAGDLSDSALMTAWSAQYYKLARAVGNASAFILSREILYHISRIVFFPFLMIVAYLFSLDVFFTVSFITAGALTLLFLFANKLSTHTVRV